MTVPKRSPDGEWLSAGEAAKALHIHYNTIKRIPSAELPYWRAGVRGDRRYNREDIAAYIERRMVR